VTLHLIKLCVGADSVADLAEWQEKRLAQARRKKKPAELMHITRMMPKRADEIVGKGSLYWVIKGQIAVRQRILELRPVTREARPACAIVYDEKLIPVQRRFHRPFQGWRYLEPKDAPADIKGRKRDIQMSDQLRAQLTELGLL
jgi:hypothetical protein